MSHTRAYTVAEDRGMDVLLDPSFPYREELLQLIWEQRLFDPLNLCTMDGDTVEVLRPGRLHKNSGPRSGGGPSAHRRAALGGQCRGAYPQQRVVRAWPREGPGL